MRCSSCTRVKCSWLDASEISSYQNSVQARQRQGRARRCLQGHQQQQTNRLGAAHTEPQSRVLLSMIQSTVIVRLLRMLRAHTCAMAWSSARRSITHSSAVRRSAARLSSAAAAACVSKACVSHTKAHSDTRHALQAWGCAINNADRYSQSHLRSYSSLLLLNRMQAEGTCCSLCSATHHASLLHKPNIKL